MIEFQYFDGCPNSTDSLNNLLELQKELNLPESIIKIMEISNQESAEKLNFQGSPSILINGIDIYTGKKPNSFSYSCRIYIFNGEKTGIIPKDYLYFDIVIYLYYIPFTSEAFHNRQEEGFLKKHKEPHMARTMNIVLMPWAND